MKEYIPHLEFTEEIIEDIDTQVESLGPCKIPNPMKLPETSFITDDTRITLRLNYVYLKENLKEKKDIPSLEVAGPRPYIYFDPSKVKVGIVTCGGLCPGINDVFVLL